MTEYIEQGSASDRYEAARKALEKLEWWPLDGDRPFTAILNGDDVRMIHAALRALITPPSVGESVEQIAERVIGSPEHSWITWDRYDGTQVGEDDIRVIAEQLVRAGIQSAHETWEPEVALRPTQEQMLRWLGIEYARSDDSERLIILSDTIDREED